MEPIWTFRAVSLRVVDWARLTMVRPEVEQEVCLGSLDTFA